MKERLWEPDDGLVCMAPPVIGLSKAERKQASSTPYSKNSTITRLTKKSISVKEVDEKMKADSATLPKENQNYQTLEENNNYQLSESHPPKMPKR